MGRRRRAEERMHDLLSQRVMNWHQLLWQVPLFAFTAQAFTFTIALDPGTTLFARFMACGLSILISVVSLFSLVRQRKADLTDSAQLARIEERWDWDGADRLHGKVWADKRKAHPFGWKPMDVLFGRSTLTLIWAVAFIVLIGGAIAVVVVGAVSPELLSGPPTTTPPTTP